MPTGKVKWFDEQQGFGYILTDDGGPDVFVHHSVIKGDENRSLAEGQSVEYEVEVGPRGPRAVSAKPIGS